MKAPFKVTEKTRNELFLEKRTIHSQRCAQIWKTKKIKLDQSYVCYSDYYDVLLEYLKFYLCKNKEIIKSVYVTRIKKFYYYATKIDRVKLVINNNIIKKLFEFTII